LRDRPPVPPFAGCGNPARDYRTSFSQPPMSSSASWGFLHHRARPKEAVQHILDTGQSIRRGEPELGTFKQARRYVGTCHMRGWTDHA